MEQAGEYVFAAPRERVWAALNDPELLRRSIDGCQSLEQTSDSTFAAAVKAKIGPLSGLFNVDLELTHLTPPDSYTITASAKGGAAGFAKGSATVNLQDRGVSTQLSYAVKAKVEGELAQIESQLIDSAAQKMADDFFAKFADEVGALAELATANAEQAIDSQVGLKSPAAAPRQQQDYQPSGQGVIWAIMFGVLILAVVLTL